MDKAKRQVEQQHQADVNMGDHQPVGRGQLQDLPNEVLLMVRISQTFNLPCPTQPVVDHARGPARRHRLLLQGLPQVALCHQERHPRQAGGRREAPEEV